MAMGLAQPLDMFSSPEQPLPAPDGVPSFLQPSCRPVAPLAAAGSRHRGLPARWEALKSRAPLCPSGTVFRGQRSAETSL